MAVMNKASTRPEEYAIDIGITTSERIDAIIRVDRARLRPQTRKLLDCIDSRSSGRTVPAVIGFSD